MKYLLKNKTTGEEHLCEKVVIDGFEYYITDKITSIGEKSILQLEGFTPMILTHFEECEPDYEGKKIIATNNPNIDLPQVIDEVVYEAYKAVGEDIAYNDLLVTAWCDGYSKAKEETPFSEEDMLDFLKWVEKSHYWKSTDKRFPQTVGLWTTNINGNFPVEQGKTTKELLEIWKQQRPKTIWYE